MEEAGSTSEQSFKNKTKQKQKSTTRRAAANVSTHTLCFMINIQACKLPKQHIVQSLVVAEQKHDGCSCGSDGQRAVFAFTHWYTRTVTLLSLVLSSEKNILVSQVLLYRPHSHIPTQSFEGAVAKLGLSGTEKNKKQMKYH